MSRSFGAAAGAGVLAGVCAFAFALSSRLGAGASRPAAPPTIAYANQAASIDPLVEAQIRALAVLRHRHPSGVLLAPGAGYQPAAGSGRVRGLQRRRAGWGFAPGRIDGRHGPLTNQAVKRFQNAHRLSVNGILGAATLHALRLHRPAQAPTRRSIAAAPTRSLDATAPRAGVRR